MPTLEPDDIHRQAFPVLDVTVQNWPDEWAKPPAIKSMTFRTYIIDPAGAGNGTKQVQICEYEPRRARIVIQVPDQAVMLTLDPPNTSPDTSSVTVGGQGRYLPATNAYEYILYGPNPMWLNSIVGSTTGRVTVTREYC
jgi:hypothetical protein